MAGAKFGSNVNDYGEGGVVYMRYPDIAFIVVTYFN